MKRINILLIAVFTLSTMFAACGKDRPSAPVVTLTEVGHDNSHRAVVGDDMHLEADIMAEGLIKSIFVELHAEEAHYEIEQEYTTGKYIGVKNTEFHEHIDIPADAPMGEYHLHFVVTDQQNQQTSATAHVDVVAE